MDLEVFLNFVMKSDDRHQLPAAVTVSGSLGRLTQCYIFGAAANPCPLSNTAWEEQGF